VSVLGAGEGLISVRPKDVAWPRSLRIHDTTTFQARGEVLPGDRSTPVSAPLKRVVVPESGREEELAKIGAGIWKDVC
jgi:hypothetical protein